MEIRDSRRLTGANLQGPDPSAVAEVSFQPDEEAELSLEAWRRALQRILPSLNLDPSQSFARRYAGGACIGFAAPIDQLYAATEANEWAIEAANAARVGSPEPDLDEALETIKRGLAEEANQAALDLEEAARERDCPFLWDDDEISLGYGLYGQVWAARSLPKPETVNWQALGRIPVALVTGTNGKTTTSRILTRIMKIAGYTVGSTSTDGVCVNEHVVEAGDWTGTGAARMVLRRQDVTAAVLETARGGLLRRGLAVERCDVAIVTNVAADHLGDYGINDVTAMAEVKNLVCAAVDGEGYRVINADDPQLMARVGRYNTPLILYSLSPQNEAIQVHCAKGGEAWVLVDGSLTQRVGAEDRVLMLATDMPSSFGGAARHNISNALAASAAASALGLDHDPIRQALSGFGASPEDNPGRCQLVEVNDVRLLFDFGHNPHGLEAILGLAQALLHQRSGARLCVSLGQAGDRQDQEIIDLALTLASVAPDHVIIREMTGYERGRAYQEVPKLIESSLRKRGLGPEQIQIVDGEIPALEAAMAWARPGDLIMLLVHLERNEVAEWVNQTRIQG